MIYGKCREDVDALPVGLGLDTVVLLLLVKLYQKCQGYKFQFIYN